MRVEGVLWSLIHFWPSEQTWNWMVRVTSDFYFDFLYKLIFDLQSFDNGEKDDFDGSEHDVIVESSLPVFFFLRIFSFAKYLNLV